MTRLADVASNIRAKNAGPFWLTIDVFCGSPEAFARVRNGLATERVAKAFQVAPDALKRFELDDLHVLKFSLPRPTIQGKADDRDMHGASYAVLLADIEV